MKYLSVCSGIEAATAAWHPLGWEPFAFSEIEPFPSAVLAHHYPDVPNLGDMTKFKEWPDATIDLLVGGTPCQSFSIAGLRKGLADPRGNLMLTYLAIADKYRPRWLVWENVPGVLSSWSSDDPPSDLEEGQEWEATETSDFGCLLSGMAELGYGFAYRVLDAQYFGVAQRRRRVFVVGHLGDWRRAAAVLFEQHSLQGHPAPSRKAGKVAPTIPSRSTGGGGLGTDFDLDGGLIQSKKWPADVCSTLDTTFGTKQGLEDLHVNAGCPMFVPATAHSLRGEGFDASEDGTGRGTPIVPVAGAICKDSFSGGIGGRPEGAAAGHFIPVAIQAGALRENPTSGPDGVGVQEHIAYTLEARPEVQAVAFDCKASGQNGFGIGEIASTLRAMGHAGSHCNGGGHQAVAFGLSGEINANIEHIGALDAGSKSGGGQPSMCLPSYSMQVRRLTPRECERLQGFEDDYTLIPYGRRIRKEKLDMDFIKYQMRGNPKHLTRDDIDKLAADGPRYKALGNSMARTVMQWLGERIDQVDAIKQMEPTP